MSRSDPSWRIEQAARHSYGRLLAFLAARSRDLAAAEDALADAFAAALADWPRLGVPANPEAWLLTVARRRLADAARRGLRHETAVADLMLLTEEAAEMAGAAEFFPDQRLALMFVCAHPAIDASARTPLMLQSVLGLDAARIATAFLIKPAAMSQRLVRAKAKIRDAAIPFEIPEAKDLPERLTAVRNAIYAAFGAGWDEVSGAETPSGLAQEALDLGDLLVRLSPDEPESLGLLSLMLHCEARRPARFNAGGVYVPLSEQDSRLWSQAMIVRAEACLLEAARFGRMGRFQLEAAIQSVHAGRVFGRAVDRQAIALLYEGLARDFPSVGALVGRAAAIAEARGAEAGWELLEQLPADLVADYQPFWALAAHLLVRLGRFAEAAGSYDRAIGLSANPALRGFLLQKRREAVKLPA